MSQTETVAFTQLLCIEQDGTRRHVLARICLPFQREDGMWACPLDVQGLPRGNLQDDVIGLDSLQATCLALSFMRAFLEECVQAGSRLELLKHGSPFPLESYFAGVGYNGSST